MTVDRITRNQRLLDLAKTIEEAPDHQLDMKTWMIDKRPDDWEFMDDGNHQTEEVRSALLNHTCGTAACVAGWAVALFAEDMTVNLDIEEEAKKLLGLNNREAEIFYEFTELDDSGDDVRITKETVVQKIRNLVLRD